MCIKGRKDAQANVFGLSGFDNPCCLFQCRILRNCGTLEIAIRRDNGIPVLIKGDQMPLGMDERCIQSFSRKTIPVNGSEKFYIFSDGIIDQFGGVKNKKFMMAKFQQSVLLMQNMDLALQKEFLHKTFRDWKGENEQLDDILVIGFTPFSSVPLS